MLECTHCKRTLPDNFDLKNVLRAGICTQARHDFRRVAIDTSRKAPCRWCSTDVNVKASYHSDESGSAWYVECDACGARGPARPTPQMAMRAWNQTFMDEVMHTFEMAAKDEQVQGCHPTPYDLTHANIVLGYTGDMALAGMTLLKR